MYFKNEKIATKSVALYFSLFEFTFIIQNWTFFFLIYIIALQAINIILENPFE